jgi:hypothetical protein
MPGQVVFWGAVYGQHIYPSSVPCTREWLFSKYQSNQIERGVGPSEETSAKLKVRNLYSGFGGISAIWSTGRAISPDRGSHHVGHSK